MRTILFHIPREVSGVPLFGWGALVAIWAVLCAARIAWNLRRHDWSAQTWGELPVMLLMGAIFAFVFPVLTDDYGLPIRGYGVMLFLGVVSGVGLAAYRARREGYDPELIYSLAFWMCLSGIVGARLFYIIEYWSEFQKPTLGATLAAMANYTQGGLIVYGSLVGAAVAAFVFFVRHKLPVLAMADLIVPSLTLGLALGRVGCFLNGCCYGGLCDRPWAVQFPPESPPYVDQAARGEIPLYGIYFSADRGAAVIRSIDEGSAAKASGLQADDRLLSITVQTPGEKRPLVFPPNADMAKPRLMTGAEAAAALMATREPGTQAEFRVIDASGQPATRIWFIRESLSLPPRSLPVHPAQLYSAIDALLITLFLLAWYPLRRHDGEVTALLLTIYPIVRFLEEIIRTDESAIFGTGMSISQNVSLLLLAAAAVLWIYVLRSPRLKYANSVPASLNA